MVPSLPQSAGKGERDGRPVVSKFYDLVDQVTALLRQHGRLSYRALVRQFGLDDARLADLVFELIEVQRVAVDQNGTILVLAQEAPPPSPDPAEADQESSHSASPPAGPDEAEAERRHLSVLFCDLAGSAMLSAVLDPEELRDVLREYQTACAAVVERFGGVIARQVADGLLVNFGYPRAHDDDA